MPLMAALTYGRQRAQHSRCLVGQVSYAMLAGELGLRSLQLRRMWRIRARTKRTRSRPAAAGMSIALIDREPTNVPMRATFASR